MADYLVSLAVEGLHDEDGRVRLSAFVNELQTLNSLLAKIDRRVSGGKPANQFRVVGLSYDSPATCDIEVVRAPQRPDTRSAVVSDINNALEQLGRGEVPHFLGRAILEDIKNLAKPVGEKISGVSLRANGIAFDLTEKLTKLIEHDLAGVDTCEGTIEGTLEQINLHDNANVFRIYPNIGPNVVLCRFGSELRDLAISAIGSTVAVSGLLIYKTGEPFAYEILVSEIDIYPSEDELPTIEDLRGIAPDATGDMASEDFVRALRDGWEQ